MTDHLQIGKIVNTHGIRGEIKLIPLTDDPHRFNELEWVYVEKDGNRTKYTIQDVKYVKNSVVLRLSGIETVEAATLLKDAFLEIDRIHAVKLPKDSFFICDILGCSVYDETGSLLGKLMDVLQTGSNDVYVVRNESGREILLPALKSVVRNVEPDQQRIDVTIPKGLLDDEI